MRTRAGAYRASLARIASFAVVAGVVRAPPARAQDKAECASAYERAQEDRAASRLTKAREALVICAQQICPSFVQTDCVQWLSEVESEMPSVVLSAKGKDGADTVDVRVSVDGEVLVEQLDGKTKDVDPGMHVFRFELEDADPIEKQLLIRQGEKNRVIDVSFAPAEVRAKPETPPAAPPQAPADAEHPASRSPGPLRPYAFVAGGVGALGLVSFGVFNLLGHGEETDLEKQCEPDCTHDQVQPVRTKYLIANISLGVGVAGLATGAVLYFLSLPDSASPAADVSALHVDVATLHGGGFASMSGRF